MRKTSRGFSVFSEFIDTCGALVSVHESSSGEGRRVWLDAKGGSTVGDRQKALAAECAARNYMMPGNEIISDCTSAHLTPAQARRVAAALLLFADGK